MKRGLNKENSLPDPEFGGESSESARAIHYAVQKDTLMTYEKGLFAQADPGIVSGSTTERKQMSTKTIYKRIALVAVTALGAGVLSVAPAFADNPTVASGVTHSLSTSSVSVAVGATATTTYTVGGTYISTALFEVVQSETYPTGAAAAARGATAAAGSALTLATLAAQATAGGDLAPTLTGAGTFAASTVLSLTPDKPGVYTVTLTPNIVKASSGATGAESVQVAAVTFTVYAGYSVDSAKPNNAYAVQGVNTATGWSTTAGGVGTVRLTNYPATAAVRHFVTVTGGSILTATIANNSNGANAITKDGTATYTVNLTNGANFTGGVDFVTGTSTTRSDYVDIQVQASTAGGNVTVTDTFFDAVTGSATVYATAVLTVGTAAAVSVANSTSILSVDATTALADETINASAAVGAQRGNVAITLKDQYNNNSFGQVLTATITGPGLIAFSQDTRATQGTAKVASLVLSSSQNTAFLGINGDGTGGAATIRILAGTTVIATETLSFYATARAVTAVVIEPHIQVGTATAVLEISAKDSAGQYGVGTFSAKSSNQTVVASTSALDCTQVTAANKATTYFKHAVGSYACSVTGVSAGTTKLSINWDSLVTNTNTVVDIRVTKSVAAAITLTTDKATYAPGEVVTLSFKATDADGHLIGKGASSIDWLGADSFASATSGAVKAAGTDLTNNAFNLSAGTRTTQYYAPGTPGAVTYSATLSTDTAVPAALRGTTLKATATVSSSTDIQALTTLVNSLIAKINALNKLVVKIQKKVNKR